MATKETTAPKPERLHLFAVRSIDSSMMDGAARVRVGTDFWTDAGLGQRLLKDGRAVPFADRPKWAR